MNNSLKNELRNRLLLEGYAEIVEALDRNNTDSLSKHQKDILIRLSSHVKNGESVIKANLGFAGYSPSSGESGFLSGQRSGVGQPEGSDEP